MKNFEIEKTEKGYIIRIDGAAVDKWGKETETPHVYRNMYLAKLAKQYLKNISVTIEVDSDKTDVTVKWSKPRHTRKK